MKVERSEIGKALTQFWDHVHRGEDRLAWLKRAAEWKLSRRASYRQIRQNRAGRPAGDCRVCFVCQRKGGTVRHHIIQVQYGGRNVSANIVAVCRMCHRAIHPWLKNQPITPPTTTDLRPRLVKRHASQEAV